MERGEGERLLADRRRRFWGWIIGLAAAGGVSGFVAGFVMGHEDAGLEAVTSLPDATKFAIVALLIAIFSYGTWRFAREIDEVEMADNLWGSTAGYYAYAVLFPAWWLLWKMEALREPNGWAIFWVAFVAAGAVYLWRKWQAAR